MKSAMRWACAAMLSLSLVACGGQPATTDTGSDTQTDQTEQTSIDTSAYEGKWLLAAIQYDGATVTGNFVDFYGVEEGNSMTVNADGTGVITTGTEEADFTWKATKNGTIAIKNDYDSGNVSAELVDDLLVLTGDEEPFTNIYSADGVYPNAPEVEEDGEAITSADDLLGTWSFYAVKNTSYGDYYAFGENSESLAMLGQFTSGELTFNEDGTGTMLGYDMTWETTDEGTTIVIDETDAGVTALSTSEGILAKSTVDGGMYWFKK